MSDLSSLGFYILLLLPGYIFVQTRDYHLLREKKTQFEKTFEIILWSAFIWVIACVSSFWWPFWEARKVTLEYFISSLKNRMEFSTWDSSPFPSAAAFFFVVCFYSFLFANLWGLIRKFKFVDSFLKELTGRDWYPSITCRFLQENLGNPIVVEIDEYKYLGILSGAPYKEEDHYILLTNVSLMPRKPGDKPESLSLIDSLLIKFDEIDKVQSLNATILHLNNV